MSFGVQKTLNTLFKLRNALTEILRDGYAIEVTEDQLDP